MKTISALGALNTSFKQVQPLPLLDPALLPRLARSGGRAASRWFAAPVTMRCHRAQQEGLAGFAPGRPVNLAAAMALLLAGLGAGFLFNQMLAAALLSDPWLAVASWVTRLVG